MPAWDHLGDAANDLAFTQGLIARDRAGGRHYLRLRVAATIWIPAFMVAILAGAWASSWGLAAGLMVLTVALLAVYVEGAGALLSRVRRKS
jgi:hypothetical protein